MGLELTPWGKFVMQYSVMVPRNIWDVLRKHCENLLESGQDWKFFLGELAAGCNELGGEQERLCEIICMEEED